MAIQKSILEGLTKKNLVTICKKLYDMGFDFESPYDDYDDSESKAITILRFYNVESLEYIDIDFLSEFFMTNIRELKEIFETKENSLISELFIPESKEYIIYTDVRGSCTFEETFKDTWSSYNQKLCGESVNQAHYDGNFDYYMGDSVGSDYDNYDTHDSTIRVGEPVNESHIKKYRIIDKLDKKTLLELRGLIDKRLKVL